MDYQNFLYKVEESVATITINRPDKLNIFTSVMQEGIIAALDEADADDHVRAVIITGSGRCFCAGADLSRGASAFDIQKREGASPIEDWRGGGGLVSLGLFESKKPLIAAVNGPAVVVGVTMQLPMDIRIASTDASFGFVFTRRGVLMEACSSWFLPRIVGISQAMEWVMSRRVFRADEALTGGLISRVIAPDVLLGTARNIATEIADNTSGISVALCRHMIWKMLGADHPMEAHKVDSRSMRSMGQLPDAYEGVQSFLEKRPGKYTMKPSTDMAAFFPWREERHFE